MRVNKIGGSWSGFRARYERDFLAQSLQGRLRFFCTRSHGYDDEIECIIVKFDGKEILRTTHNKYWEKWQEKKKVFCERYGIDTYFNVLEGNIINSGSFLIRHLYKAAHDYLNQSIERSLTDENALVRMFAVLDRRVGKRRLKQFAGRINEEPEWLQQFYLIRLQSEAVLNGKRTADN